MFRISKAIFLFLILCTTVAFGQSHHSAYSLSFDGVDDYVDCGELLNELNLPFTFSSWVYKEANTNQYIFSSSDNTDGSGDYYTGFWVDISSGISLAYGSNTGNTIADKRGITNTREIPVNQWTHIAVVATDKDNIIAYINGVDAEGTLFGALDSSVMINHNNGKARLGMQSLDDNYYYKGKLDEMRVWKYARTQTEIQADMCSKLLGNENNLVAYWRFDELDGDSLYEFVTNTNGGLINADTLSALTVSGAAIGDASAFLYDTPLSDTSLMINGANGEKYLIDSIFGSSKGLHLYYVDTVPNYTGGLKTALSPYIGVFVVDSLASDTISYRASVYYSNHPLYTGDNDFTLSIPIRDSNTDTDWDIVCIDADYDEKRLSVNGIKGNKEFIIDSLIKGKFNVSDYLLCEKDTTTYLVAYGDSIYWYSDNAYTDTINEGNLYDISDSISFDSIGSYVFYIQGKSAACEQRKDTMFIEVRKRPAMISVTDTSICDSDTIVIPNLIATGGDSVSWYSDFLLQDLVFYGDTFLPEDLESDSLYFFFVTNDSANGCSSFIDTSQIKIVEVPKPTVDPVDTCYVEGLSVTMTAEGEYVKWYNSPSCDSNALISEINTYSPLIVPGGVTEWLYLKDSTEGCYSDMNMTVFTIKPTPIKPSIINTFEEACEDEDSTVLIGLISGDYSMKWLPSGEEGETTIEVKSPGEVIFEVTNNKGGCTNSDTLEVEFMDCSCEITNGNLISPNGDNENDSLSITIDCDFSEYKLKVYNRYGKLLFETNNIEESWDGNDGNGECSDGVYYWVIRILNTNKDKKERYSGFVHLIRKAK